MEQSMILFEIIDDKNESKLLAEMEYISLEEGFIKTVTSPFVKAFRAVDEKMVASKNVFLGFLENRGTLSLIKDVNKRRVSAVKLSRNVNYGLIDDISVRTIVGMQSRLIFIAKMNKEKLEYVDKNFSRQVNDIDTRLAKFIGDNEVRKSFRVPSSNLKEIRDFTNGVKKELGTHFSAKDVSDVKPLKNVIGNNNEYAEVFTLLKETNGIVTDKLLISVKKKTDKITERINVIYDILESKDLEVSKETLTGLIEAVDIMSEYITVISGIYYSHMKAMEVALGVHKVYIKFKDKK